MKQILDETGYNFYDSDDTPRSLAKKVFDLCFGRPVLKSDLPIDPFKILLNSGALYVFLDFKDLEGFYNLPSQVNEHQEIEYGYVGINKNRPLERQRFSAAHELCHHLKDNHSSITKQGSGDKNEQFANNFASELLIPRDLLKEIIGEINIQPYQLDEVLSISVDFGVSFQAMLLAVSNLLGWTEVKRDMKKIIKTYKPNGSKKRLGLSNELTLIKQMFNSFEFVEMGFPEKIKNDFLRYVITNDHKIENGKVSTERISELMALRRFYGDQSLLKKVKLNADEIEVIGQYKMYEIVFEEKNEVTSFDRLINLHTAFYSCAPYPEVGGKFRETAARVTGAGIKTSHPYSIYSDVLDLCSESELIIKKEYDEQCLLIEEIARIHHRLTVIHPFHDGNGRTSRAFMNTQLIHFKVPPLFILLGEKDEYIEALHQMDKLQEVKGNIEGILLFLMKKIINNYSIFLPQDA